MSAELDVAHGRYRAASFRCQQSVEKTLKGLMEFYERNLGEFEGALAMDTDLQRITSRVRGFVAGLQTLYPIKAAYLFGSWAVGRQSESSDVDIGIFVEDSVDEKSRFDIFSKGKDFDIDFDVVVLPESDFLTEDPVVVHEMKTKGIRIV